MDDQKTYDLRIFVKGNGSQFFAHGYNSGKPDCGLPGDRSMRGVGATENQAMAHLFEQWATAVRGGRTCQVDISRNS
jgi:hypothetical protein